MFVKRLHCLDLQRFEAFCTIRGWAAEATSGAPVVLRMRKDNERDRLTAVTCKGSEMLALNGPGRRMLAKFHKEHAVRAAASPATAQTPGGQG